MELLETKQQVWVLFKHVLSTYYLKLIVEYVDKDRKQGRTQRFVFSHKALAKVGVYPFRVFMLS